MRLARRKDVDDAAAAGEFAVLIRGVFAGESGVDEERGQIGGRDVLARPKIERRGEHAIGHGHTRENRGGRGDNHSSRAARDRVQRARSDRGDTDVRRQTAIWIDFMRWERQHGVIGGSRRKSFERREKKADVRAGLLQIRVARHDIDVNGGGLRLSRGRHEERFCRVGES